MVLHTCNTLVSTMHCHYNTVKFNLNTMPYNYDTNKFNYDTMLIFMNITSVQSSSSLTISVTLLIGALSIFLMQ